MILWLSGKSCKRLSSFGDLDWFKSENAYPDAADHCKRCPHKEDCVYSGYEVYKRYPQMVVQPTIRDYTVENAYDVIESGDTQYDKCVYKGDNDVCDHQTVNMQLTGGVIANLTMNAFSEKCYRRTQVCGSLGEINGLIEDGEIRLSVFGKEEEIIKVKCDDALSQHCGGDRLLLLDFLDYVEGKGKGVCLTSLDKSVESHVMAFAAERSRLNGGAVEVIENER